MSFLKTMMILTLLWATSLSITAQNKSADENFNIGKSYHQKGKYDSARIFLERASLQFNNPREKRKKVQSWSWLGWAYMDLARNREADSVLRQAIHVGENAWGLNDLDVAFGYHILAKTYGSMAKHDESNEYVRRSLRVRKDILGDRDNEIAQNYEMFGFNFRSLADYDSAEYYYDKALSILVENVGEDHITTARIYAGLAWLNGARGDIQKSLELSNRALKIREQKLSKGHPLITSTLGHNCWCYSVLGDYSKAMACQEHVMELRKEALGQDHPMVATDLISIGYTSSLLGDYEKAIRYQTEGIRLLELKAGKNLPQLVRFHSFLASCHRQQGNEDLFLHHSMRAFDIGSEILEADNPEMVRVYRLLATYFGQSGQYNKQLEFLNKALKTSISRFGNTHSFSAIVLSLMGEFYEERGAMDLAKKHHFKSLETVKKLYGFYHPVVANQLSKIGALYRSQHQYDSALNYHQQSLQSVSESFSIDDVSVNPTKSQIIGELVAIYTLIEKGRTFMELSQNQAAPQLSLEVGIQCFDLAMALIDDIRNGYTTEESKEQLYENASIVYHLSVEALRSMFVITADDKYLTKAFEVSERSKSFILLHTLNDHKAHKFAGVPTQVVEKERNIRIGLTYFKKKLFKSKSRKDTLEVNTFNEVIFNLQREYDELVEEIEEKNPEYYSLKYDQSEVDINWIQEIGIEKNEAVMEFLITANNLYLFSISQTGVRWYDLGSVEGLDIMVAGYRKATTDYSFIVNESEKADELYFSSASQLYQLLLADALGDLSKDIQKLTIIPDGTLGQLNFEAFLTEAPSKKITNYSSLPFLIKKYQLSYAYSVAFLKQIRELSSDGAESVFGGFAPTYSKTLAQAQSDWSVQFAQEQTPLKGAIEEVRQISDITDGDLWLGDQATESNFKRNASQYNLLHLAMHGNLDDGNPLYSELLFASANDSVNDGHLDLAEIYNLRLNADLVVLSACNTGTGKIQKGEGNISLSRAFAYAGCPSVIMSLWKIPDIVTSKIMINLYQNLFDQDYKDEALRDAKLQYLNEIEDPFDGHPYFWAGFVLMGDNDPIDLGQSNIVLWMIGLIVLIIVIATLQKFRSRV